MEWNFQKKLSDIFDPCKKIDQRGSDIFVDTKIISWT